MSTLRAQLTMYGVCAPKKSAALEQGGHPGMGATTLVGNRCHGWCSMPAHGRAVVGSVGEAMCCGRHHWR